MMLVTAFMLAPLAGITDIESDVLHRVDMEGIPVTTWATADHAVAVCGTHVKLLNVRWADLRTNGTPFRRCPECRTWRKP